MNFEVLKKNPFYLKNEDIEWVKNTLNDMTEEEKVGQLFCCPLYAGEQEKIAKMVTDYKIGAVMGRKLNKYDAHEAISAIQKLSKIPLLVSANIEEGGDGMILEGTNVGPNLQIAATNDVNMAYKLGEVVAKEGAAVGVNWAFAPVIDIGLNWRNPVIATRVFGANPQFVKEAGLAFTKAAQENGMAVSLKHFPGDGVDERDQHLVVSINSLTCEEWDKSFGEAYKTSIDAGALTVMVGHIMLPAYSKKLNPSLEDKNMLPASLSSEILNGLLREKLGFNGLISTDSTTMSGFNQLMPRNKVVPYSIEAGCDMFLFTKNLDEDIEFMIRGVKDGTLSRERLDEAVMRILGVKASLKLHEKKKNGTLVPLKENIDKVIGCNQFKEYDKECSDKSITLVKNLENLIPINTKKHKRIYLYPYAEGRGFGNTPQVLAQFMKEKLEKEGFEVTIHIETQGVEGEQTRFEEMVEKYDLLLYVANLSSISNQTTVRMHWGKSMGDDCPNFMQTVPTVFISFANPYHLIDVPRIKTFINAYKFKESAVDAVIDKMLGRSEFKGVNPVDPFLDMWDTRL